MGLDDLIYQNTEWLKGTGPQSNIVISSRIRLARNVEKLPFSHWANKEKEKEMLSSLKAEYDDTGKSKAQRLRAVLFRNWEQSDEG